MNASEIKAKARELGFDLCGIAPAAAHPELAFLRDWLERGYARRDGLSASFREAARRRPRTSCRRRDPSSSPAPSTTPTGRIRPSAPIRDRAHIARYAWGDDYHDVIGAAAGRAARVDARARRPSRSRRAPTSTPVRCRSASTRSTPGSAGSARTRCVINPELGSWIFLGGDHLQPAARGRRAGARSVRHAARCASRRARRSALVAPGVLDATRCISYLTIEQRGAIPDEHRARRRHARLRLRHLPGSVSVESDGAGVRAIPPGSRAPAWDAWIC